MNNIVERLRQHALPDPHDEREVMHAPLLKEAADLIDSLQARANTLESAAVLLAESAEDLRDKLAAATKRIAELEAELGAGHLQCIADRQKYKHELAALRQKIEDAPVVAYESSVSGDITRKCYEDSDIELIRKEDLTK